ncbi:MAG: TadE family protein, partial [Candidatus Rifleibacteriota bacterium]
MKKLRKGQAVVEMALVLPIFIFLLIGIFDFGRALHTWSNLNFQCMQAARAATKRINPLIARDVFGVNTHPDLTEVQAAFWKNRSPLMPQDMYINPTFTGIGTNAREVRVSASFKLSLYTPLVGGL